MYFVLQFHSAGCIIPVNKKSWDYRIQLKRTKEPLANIVLKNWTMNHYWERQQWEHCKEAPIQEFAVSNHLSMCFLSMLNSFLTFWKTFFLPRFQLLQFRITASNPAGPSSSSVLNIKLTAPILEEKRTCDT